MRRILVDHARARRTAKRGGGQAPITLEGAELSSEPQLDLLDLDRALEELAKLDPRLVRVVELRYFAGLTLEETAEALDIGEATVGRDWRTARAFLSHRLAK